MKKIFHLTLPLWLAMVSVVVLLGLAARAQKQVYAAMSVLTDRQDAPPGSLLQNRGSRDTSLSGPARASDASSLDPLTSTVSAAQASGGPGVITVCSTCVYTNVQAAVSAVAAGGVVKVAQGVYTDTDGDGMVVEITKTIRLQGGYTTTNWSVPDPVAYPTILDGEGSAQVVHVDSGSLIEGFHIRNGNASNGGGVHIAGSAPDLQRNRVYSNTAVSGGGVYIAGGTPTLENNLIYANAAWQQGGGIFVAAGTPLLQHNTLSGNDAGNEGGGIYVSLSGTPAISATIVVSSVSGSGGGGIHSAGGLPALAYNDVWNNLPGNYFGVVSGTGSLSADPLFVFPSSSAADFHLRAGSPVIDQVPITTTVAEDHDGLVRPVGAGADMGAHEFYAGTCFVRIETSGIYTSVQTAVDAASGSDQIKVAGLCTGSGSGPVVTLDKALTLQGGYTITSWSSPDPLSYSSILDGEGTRQVLMVTSTAEIAGFHIRNGYVTGGGGGIHVTGGNPVIRDNDIYSNTANNGTTDGGGGIFIAAGNAEIRDNQIYSNTATGTSYGGGVFVLGSSPQILDNVIYGNAAVVGAGRGGGLYIASSASSASVRGNVIRDNEANLRGGGIFVASGSATIEENQVYRNKTISGGGDDGGGGIYVDSGSPIIRANEIYQNTIEPGSSGGGIYVGFASGSIIERNTIYNNSGGYRGGGIYVRQNNQLIRNNLVYSNTATSYGAGIVFWWGDSIVENNTVYANIGDGMYNEGSGSPIIRNNIVISNTGTGIRRKTGTLVVYYNDVIGNAKDYSAVISTTTDISADPLFVNPGVDFRLQAGSPAIDAADPNNYSDDDHRGYARPFGARADIGAYEFYTGTCFSQVEGAAPIYATVQEAVNAASSGGGVKAAGRCEGAYAHLGTISQTVYISQPLTLSGGYTLSNWLSPTVPTTLDAQGKGRVIYITGTGVVTVERFIIRGGAAITGGGIYVAAPLSPTVQNVIFYSNTADFGGGFGSAGGVPRLDNNTFVTNTAVYSGGAIYFGAGLPLVRNTIVVSNAAAAGGGIFATPVATPSLAYNDVWRNVGGDYAGNASAGLTDFSLDPRFVDSAAANFHLQSDSPAIHAADPQTTLVWDFEGDPRPLGRGYDTGADESTAYPDLSFAPDLLDGGIPDQQITYTHFLTNVGTITDTFDLTHTLTVSGTAGWVVNDYTPVFTLTAGKRAALTITVRVPGDAVSGTYAVVVLTATSRTNGDIYDTAQNTSIANLNPGSQFTPRYAQNVNPGAVFTYVHTLTNTGNAAETYNITWSSSRGWAKAVTPTLITELDPQMTATVWVSMVVPATMPGGITETTILTVAGDFNTQSVVTDTTRVNYTTGDRYVATTGDDTLNNCLVSDAPCGTLVYAMDQATSGSTVKVAAGTYNEHDIIVNKDVILRGGYTVDDWTTFNPWKHQTIIDAQRNGRIFYIFGDPTIEGFWLQNGATDGSGGAVYVGFGSPVLNGNFFVDNTAGVNGGGFYAANGSPDLWNNVFYDNVAAGDGGGVYVAGGNTRIWHNTIYSNTAEKGGGVALAGGSLAVSNTIVVSNSATTGGGFYRAGGSSTLDYNDTWGNVNGDYVGLSAGSNSTSTNPLFVDPASADLHLQAASPLIDIGDGTSLINDMDGQPRTMGGGADIGADEYLRAGVELAPPFTSQGLPRHVALYTHTLTNTGNYTDTFVLSAQSNQGWVVTVPVTVEIGAGLNITVLAEVAIPAAAISGTVDTTEITATSSLAPSVSGVVTDTTTVALKHDVSLKPAYTGFADSNPSGVVPEYYLHTLTNEGNYTDTFNLIGVSGQGWGVGINPSIVTLGAGEKITVSVAVTVPAVPTDTVLVDITFITATVEVYTSAFAVITDTTYVNVRPGLVLAPDRTGSGKPGTSVFYSLILTNTGNYTDTIEFDAFSSEDWPTTSVADMDLGPGLSTIVLYEVKIPGSTLSNTVDIGSLIASSSQFGVADSAMVSTTVEQAPGVTLQRKWPNASGWCVIAPYSGLPYLFELSNTGNYTDTFDIGAQSAQGWSVTFPLDVTVGPELDTNVWVYLDVPTTTAQIVDTLTVSATSRADNSVTGLASYFTKVNWDVGVSLDPNYNGTVIVEDSIVYTHIVTNTGVDFNIIQFSSQDSQGWPVNITPSQASLNPGDSAMVTVVISVPLDEVNVTDVTVITATTTIDCLARAIAVDVTSVTRPRVTLGPNYVQDVAPGNVFTYVHSLENTGAIDDSYVITYAQAADWSVTVTPTLVSSILPGVTMPVRVAVMPPPGTLAGITNVVTVTAISQRSAAIYDIAVNTTTVPYLPSALLTPARSGSAEPGGIVTYTHALTNTGNLTDTFMLAPHPGAFAYASVSPGSVILAPGETYTNIQVAVYILPYAPRGSTESTQLIAVFSKTQVVVIDNTFVNTIASTRYVAPNGFDTNNNCTDLNFAPCATVQHAIDQAISGDMILVAQGVYTGTTSKLVVAAGTADDPFMVDAARTAKLEAALAAYAYTETTTSTLSAADMALIDAASTITQLVYLDKSLTLWGGFSTTDWETSKPEERPTVLDAGGQGRGIYVTAVTSTMGITPTIRGFHIRNGAVNGDGAGVYVEPGAVPIIAQNRIYSNTASGSGSEGGGIYYGGAIGDVRLWNNLFYHNHADDLGGGLYNSGGNATVWNSTFYSNTAGTGGGIYIASGMPGISNTIVVDNAGTGIYNASGAPALAYNDVWGNTPVDYSGVISAGVGSLSMDPLFLNPSGGDFRLRTDSPAVNAGGPLAVFPDLDLAGNQRPLEGRHDMGAYENGITSLKASVGAAVSGQVVTYTITIANTGSQVWLGATLTDTLHPYLDYAGSLLYSAGSGQYITASRTIDWTGPVYTSTPTLITFTARITDWIASGTVITNLAWVNYAGTNVVSTTVSASSGVRYVSTTGFDTGNGCKSPVQPCQTVQRAVAQALVNDEVKVSAGVYTDTLNAGQVVSVSKSITLTGGYAPGTWAYAPETYQTTLDGQNAGHGVVVTGPVTVTLAGFHVIQNVDGIHVTGGSLTLKRTQVYSSTGHGVAVESGSYTLINNLIVHNAGAGLWTNNSTGVLNHNTFAGNTLAGAWVDRTASFTNTIFYNHTVGISVTTGSTATLSHSVWYSNTFDTLSAGTVISSTNFYGDPLFTEPDALDYHILISSSALDTGADTSVGEDIDGDPRPLLDGPDIGADEFFLQVAKQGPATADPGQIITYTIAMARAESGLLLTDTLPLEVDYAGYVACSTGVCSYLSGQRAIVWAGDGAAGQVTTITYTVRITTWLAADTPLTNTAAIKIGVNVFETEPAVTSIDALSGTRYVDQSTGVDADGPANNCLETWKPCQTLQWAVDQALAGDTVKVAGGQVASAGLYTDTLGAGQVVQVGTSIALVGGYDPATWTYNPASFPTTLDGQGSGRVIEITGGAVVTVDGFRLINGAVTGDGGGLRMDAATVSLTNVEIYNNSAQGSGGGVYGTNSVFTITNSILASNHADGNGGGLSLTSNTNTQGTLRHTTIVDNGAQGIAVGDNFTLYLTNTVIVSHTVGITTTTGSAAAIADHTLWQAVGTLTGGSGSVVTTNNLTGDPRFVDPAASDYHIRGDSAALGAGIRIGVGTDIDGDTRPAGLPVDLGADQYPLRVTRSAAPVPASPGARITHTLTLTNLRAIPLTGVQLTETLPAEVSYVPGTLDSSAGTGGVASGVLTWGGTISNSVTITFAVQINPYLTDGTIITFMATVNDPVSIFDTTPFTATVETLEATLAKAAPAGAAIGEVITYTLVFTIPPGHVAYEPTLVDELPRLVTGNVISTTPALTYVTGSGAPAPATVSSDGGTITWTLPTVTATLNAPAVVTVTFGAQVHDLPGNDAGDILTNTLALSYTETTASGPAHALSGSKATTLVEPVLSLVKTMSPAEQISPLDTVLVSVVFTNTGDSPLYDVVLTDTLPGELAFLSATPGYGLSGQTVTWAVSVLDTGSTAVFTISTQTASDIDVGLTLTNAVEVRGTSLPGLANEERAYTATAQATASTAPDLPLLWITKSVDSPTALPGDLLTYTLTVSNTGLANAFNLTISDTLPAQTAYQSCSGAPCAQNGGVVTWTVSSLPTGNLVQVAFTVQVDTGVVSGTAVVNQTYSAAASQGVPAAGLPVSTTVKLFGGVSLAPDQVGNAQPGDQVIYQHTLTNTANTPQTVSLSAASSEGWQVDVAPVSVFLSPGAFTNVTVTVTVGSSATSGTVDTTTITATGSITGSAAVQDTTQVLPSLCTPVSGAAFIYNPAVPTIGETVSFSGTAAAGSDPVTYTWDFGDGLSAQGQVVTHSFAGVTSYTVSMTATNACGTDTAQEVIVVNPVNIYLPIVVRNGGAQ